MTRLFITSSGTGIGKTFLTAELTRHARSVGKTVRAVKPVISGFTEQAFPESDTALLLQAMELDPTPSAIDRCSPWRFAAPLSPDMAARRENRGIDFQQVVDWCREAAAGAEEIVLVEGVGGAMVPLDDTHTVLDWIKALNMPAVLVVGSYLGTISHTLTALAALRDVKIAAVIVNESEVSPVPLAETAATIQRFTEAKVMTLPRKADQPEFFRSLGDIFDLLTM